MKDSICPLNLAFAVAGQLTASDIPGVATRGFATLINNRLGGEGCNGQLPSSDIELAALAAG